MDLVVARRHDEGHDHAQHDSDGREADQSPP